MTKGKTGCQSLDRCVHVEWPAPLDAALIMVGEGGRARGDAYTPKVLAADSELSEVREKIMKEEN